MSTIKYDLIVFTGAPGSGKTTISELLQKELDSPLIDFGNLRIFHLDREWKEANDKEELMSFENLVFILNNYIKNGYKNVIVNDLKDEKVLKLAQTFFRRKVAIVSLIVEDEELRKRVIDPKRDSGFRDVNCALGRNEMLKQRKPLSNELRIDNTHGDPQKTVREIVRYLESSSSRIIGSR